jgi:integrative and conjugative element protein (TIGR02256 family)
MRLLLPNQLIQRLERELRRAGSREIGGLLMGEHVGDELFRVVHISVQRSGGSHACFIRNPKNHASQLKKFFARTGNDFSRFNYLGEWHSHPSFKPVPSGIDLQTMQSMVEDPDVGVNFLVLLVCKRATGVNIEISITAFRAGAEPIVVPVQFEAKPDVSDVGLVQRVRKLFGFR